MQVSIKDANLVMEKLKVEKVHCKNHFAGFLVVDGLRILKVHCSFGTGNMPPAVVHLFRKSLKLTPEEFHQLIGCTTTRDAYIQILRNKGIIDSPVSL